MDEKWLTRIEKKIDGIDEKLSTVCTTQAEHGIRLNHVEENQKTTSNRAWAAVMTALGAILTALIAAMKSYFIVKQQ